MWLLHLPLGNNISQSIVAIHCSVKNICHIPLAITSAKKQKEDNHLPLGNNICHIPNKAYNIYLAITSTIDTICQTSKIKISVNII